MTHLQGRTENDIAALCKSTSHMHAHSIRPAYFYPSEKYPEDVKHQRTPSAVCFNTIMEPVFGLLHPPSLTPIEDLSKFTLEVAKGRWPDQGLFRNTELRKLAKEIREKHSGEGVQREEL